MGMFCNHANIPYFKLLIYLFSYLYQCALIVSLYSGLLSITLLIYLDVLIIQILLVGFPQACIYIIFTCFHCLF